MADCRRSFVTCRGSQIDQRVVAPRRSIFWFAGQAGVEPWTYTLRQLFVQQQGQDFGAWIHTASIEAALANTVRDSKKKRKPFIMQDFHPHILHAKAKEERKKPKKKGVDISILRDIFIDAKPMEELVEEHGI